MAAALCLALPLMPVRADAPTQASAEAVFGQGKFDDARKAYERLVKSDPPPDGPHLGLVQTLLRLDHWRDALHEAQATTLVAPTDADARGLLALAEMRAGQPEAAQSDSQKALALDNDDYWGLVAAGRVADWNGQRKDNRQFFTRATLLRPERPDAWLGLWDVAEASHFGEAEIAAARKYLALDPKGQPFDRETPYLKGFVQNELDFWRHFETAPAFQAADGPPDASYTATLPLQRAGDFVIVTVGVNGQTLHLLFDLALHPTDRRRIDGWHRRWNPGRRRTRPVYRDSGLRQQHHDADARAGRGMYGEAAHLALNPSSAHLWGSPVRLRPRAGGGGGRSGPSFLGDTGHWG